MESLVEKAADGTHPDVYSAVGSHASHSKEGKHVIKGISMGIPAEDYPYNGGPIWTTRINLVNIGEKNRPLNGQEFILYSGRWGRVGKDSVVGMGDTSGPIGPAFKNDFLDEAK